MTPRAGATAGARHATTLGDDGILYVRILGFWKLAEVERFFAEFDSLHQEARRRFGRVSTLVEVESVQSPAVALDVRRRALAIKRPGDRNAMLVVTMLSLLQIKRLGSNDGFGLFTDRMAARDWLLDDPVQALSDTP